jgi:hypothetical protein
VTAGHLLPRVAPHLIAAAGGAGRTDLAERSDLRGGRAPGPQAACAARPAGARAGDIGRPTPKLRCTWTPAEGARVIFRSAAVTAASCPAIAASAFSSTADCCSGGDLSLGPDGAGAARAVGGLREPLHLDHVKELPFVVESSGTPPAARGRRDRRGHPQPAPGSLQRSDLAGFTRLLRRSRRWPIGSSRKGGFPVAGLAVRPVRVITRLPRRPSSCAGGASVLYTGDTGPAARSGRWAGRCGLKAVVAECPLRAGWSGSDRQRPSHPGAARTRTGAVQARRSPSICTT